VAIRYLENRRLLTRCRLSRRSQRAPRPLPLVRPPFPTGGPGAALSRELGRSGPPPGHPPPVRPAGGLSRRHGETPA